MSTTARLTLNIAGALAFSLAVFTLPVQAQDQRAPVLRTTTRLVQLNVVVLDSHKRPVSDLSQSDFEVFDNSRDQKLSHFSVNSTRVAAALPDPLVLTNRHRQPGETAGPVTIVLVDELIDQNAHASYYRATLQSIRSQVQKVLASLRLGQQVALYELRPEGVVVAQELTDDSAALTAAVKTIGAGQLKAKYSPVGVRPEIALAFSRAVGPGSVRKTSLTEDLRIALVKQAFQGIASHLQGAPTRKNIVWISAVFPTVVTGFDPALMAADRDAINPIPRQMLPVPEFSDPQGHYEQLHALARQLSNINVSVYPVDAKGLVTSSVVNLQGERGFMDLLASETGGRAFYDANGVDVPLREVVEQGRVAYLLGYYPGDGAWDGKYHHVEVKLKRSGLSVLCRKGYFATDAPPPKDSNAALRDVAKGMLEWSGIGVTLNVSSNPLDWFDQEMVVKLDTQEIHFENKDGRWRAQLDVVFAQVSKDGRVIESVKDHLDLALLPQTYSDAATQGWFYPRTVDVNPKAEKLRVVVRDLATGAIGSVSVPIYHSKGA